MKINIFSDSESFREMFLAYLVICITAELYIEIIKISRVILVLCDGHRAHIKLCPESLGFASLNID